MKTIKSVLKSGKSILKKAGIETYSLDTELILMKTINTSKEKLISNSEKTLSDKDIKKFFDLIKKRANRIPIAYLINKKEFFGYEFYIDKNVLIPRPETEILVEWALDILNCYPKDKEIKIADIGTGSGAIAISVFKKSSPVFKNIHIYATDISDKALKIAKKNMRKLDAKINFSQGNLLEPLHEKFDLIISNPPYLTREEMKNKQPELELEPSMALEGGTDGLDFYRQILLQSRGEINPGGNILFECGCEQAREIIRIAKKINPECKTEIKKDLSDRERCVRVSNL